MRRALPDSRKKLDVYYHCNAVSQTLTWETDVVGWILATALMQAATTHPAAAEAAVPAAPAAVVSGHSVTHAGEKVRVHVPAGAVYAGSERFSLYGVADAEIHVFVEADAAKKMQRLYWVQFESYLPSNDHRYDYADGNSRMDLWGAATWVRAGAASTATPPRPGSDSESTRRILSRAGYAVPAEIMSVRMVRILDDPEGRGQGRRELMIIYGEDLAASGKTLADLRTDGKLNDAAKLLEKALIERAAKAVSVEKL